MINIKFIDESRSQEFNVYDTDAIPRVGEHIIIEGIEREVKEVKYRYHHLIKYFLNEVEIYLE